jgi:hypothetical protein
LVESRRFGELEARKKRRKWGVLRWWQVLSLLTMNLLV